MNVLIFAPHPDDEVLGVGGTIAKRAADGDNVTVCVVTRGYPPRYDADFIEKSVEEAKKAHKLLGVQNTIWNNFPTLELDDGKLHKIIEVFGQAIDKVNPDEIFIPHHGDMHLEHRLVSEAAMVALRPKNFFKPHRILAYETMSETHWNIPSAHNDFSPNVYEDITHTLSKKMEALRTFTTQIEEFPATRSTAAVEALAKVRGAVANVSAAEAFMLIREVR